MRWPWQKKTDRKAERMSTCPHLVLAPRWDKVVDIGNEDRATAYWCAACEKPLTREEAVALGRRPERAKAA